MKLTDLINGLATKVGKQNEQAIIDVLSRADLANIDIADDVANSINNGLLTIEGAKNNVAVKNHYTALALSPIDELILKAARNFELGDDFITELSGNKNTFDKQSKLADKLKETFDKLNAAKGNGNEKKIEEYTQKINDLQAQLSKISETHIPKSEFEKAKKESENAVLDYMLESKLAGLKYANKDVPADTNAKLARIILNDALTKNNAILVNEGNAMKLKQAKEPTLDYYDATNKAVTIDDFVNKTLADAKILAVSNGGNPAPPPTYVPPVYQGQPQQPINTAVIDAAIQSALGDLPK